MDRRETSSALEHRAHRDLDPSRRTQEVMSALQTFYAAGGAPVLAYQHTGALSCEIYAAGKSEFWMSPSYGTPVIRIDVFWFGLNAGSPATSFCPRFWERTCPSGADSRTARATSARRRTT